MSGFFNKNSSNESVLPDVLLRQEPEDEDDDTEGDEDGDQNGDDEEEEDGYSE